MQAAKNRAHVHFAEPKALGSFVEGFANRHEAIACDAFAVSVGSPQGEVVVLDVEALKKLYNEVHVARVFLDHMGGRKRNQNQTKTDRIVHLLAEEGQEVSRGGITSVFKQLEELGCGQFVVGRRGLKSRFLWSAGSLSVSQAAAGEVAEVQELEDEEVDIEDGDGDLMHSYHLRSDLPVTFSLPADLTKSEAARLAQFVSSLPLDEYED